MATVTRNADRMQTVDNIRNSDRVWFENVAVRSGSISSDVPEAGYYQVPSIKIDSKPEISVPCSRCLKSSIRPGLKRRRRWAA